MVLTDFEKETVRCIETLKQSDDFLHAAENGEDPYRVLTMLAIADLCTYVSTDITSAQSAQTLSDWHKFVREQCSLKHAGEAGLPVPLDMLNAFRLGLRGAMRVFYDQSSKESARGKFSPYHAVNRRIIEVDW